MSRVGLAIVFAATLAPGAWTPLVAFALAAASDYVDGPLARRAGGATRYGALLDSGADVVFVLVATAAAADAGLVWWAVPAAIAGSATPYLAATLQRARAGDPAPRAYSLVGHAAGVCNYGLAGLVAGASAMPAAVWTAVLSPASAVVVLLNAAALVQRFRR